MGAALGQPLQHVSETVLNGVASKNLKCGIPRYNAEKCKGYNLVRKRKGVISPQRIRDMPDDELHADYSELSNEVQMFLNDLQNGASSKMSMIKQQIVKADENCSILSRLAQCIRNGEIPEAERVLGAVIDGNNTALREM